MKRGLLFLMLAGCMTSPGRSAEALRKQGFTEIRTGGYDMWACGKDDSYSTSFTAKNPQGVVVSGTVCCGMWKSCTVRW